MVNMVAPCSNLDAEDSRDKGYLFLRVILFRSQKSLQGRRVLSFFSTKKKPTSTGGVSFGFRQAVQPASSQRSTGKQIYAPVIRSVWWK